jgi:hypothetical protein
MREYGTARVKNEKNNIKKKEQKKYWYQNNTIPRNPYPHQALSAPPSPLC